MSIYTDILAALDGRLAALSGLPSVAWENIAFTPVNGVAYITPSLLLAEPSQAAIGDDGMNNQIGIYQVALAYPANTGKQAIMAMADSITNHFKRGTRLTYNGQTVNIEKAWPGPWMQETDRLIMPITIKFNCFTIN